MSLKKINYSKLFIEAVSIIFAVLIALAFDAWKEELDREEAVSIARDAIIQEIRQNHRSLMIVERETAKRYEDLKIRLQAYKDDEETDIGIDMLVPELSAVAWRAANQSQVIRWFDQDTLFRLGRIYHEQSLMDDIVKSFRRYQLESDPGRSKLLDSQYKRRYLFRQNRRAKELNAYYEDFLAENDGTKTCAQRQHDGTCIDIANSE